MRYKFIMFCSLKVHLNFKVYFLFFLNDKWSKRSTDLDQTRSKFEFIKFKDRGPFRIGLGVTDLLFGSSLCIPNEC